MARRKKGGMLSDGSDSDASMASDDDGYNSQEDGDSRAERALFERKHKRPRTGGKEAAWEGIFGAEPEQQARGRGGLGTRGGKPASGSRSDWTKAPSFVASGSKPVSNAATPEVQTGSGSDANGSGSDEDEDTGADSTRPATPRVVGDEDDEPPRRMGMGMGGMSSMKAFMAGGASDAAPPPPARSGRMGLGAMKSMFDSGRKVEDERVDATKQEESTPKDPPPSAFGRSASAISAFKDANTSARSNFTASKSASPAPAAPAHVLTNTERAHFSKISTSFGARMLANMGWTPGKGLGADETGLAVPIAVKAMQRGVGISSGIRSEESKREAIRKGELVEDEPKRGGNKSARKPKKEPGAQRDGWKKEKRIKVKVEHKTYEQLIAEEDTTRAGVGLVLDARSGELKTVESLSELSLSTWTPSADTMQLPELRHNLRLILDVSKGEVTSLVKEGKAVNEKRRWSTREEQRAQTKKASVSEDIARLAAIQVSVKAIATAADSETKRGSTSLQALHAPFEALLGYKTEYVAMELDDVIVGAIDTVLHRTISAWQPLDTVASAALLATLKPWRQAFNLDTEAATDAAKTMTAWESLLWNRWLPRVRSAINNEWDPADPLPAVHLLESWDPLLPAFVRDNVLDQLVLPKVLGAVERWRPAHGSLASVVFPWLPLLGARVPQVLDEGKRRVKAVLRKWTAGDGVIAELDRWKQDVFSASEWDKLMGEHVLAKLGSVLRDDLVINPRAQDLAPLHTVLPWAPLVRASHFARLFELEFFQPWLDVLYLWLVHPGYNGDEVAQWFEMWQGVFGPSARAIPGIEAGFGAGLKLMDEAMALGAAAPDRLRKPVFVPLPSKKSKSRTDTAKPKQTPPAARAHPVDITFRSIAEEFIAAHDLILVPLGKSHPTTGKPLFRVGKTMDKGVVVYIGQDAVFAQEEGSFRAVSLEDLVQRAR